MTKGFVPISRALLGVILLAVFLAARLWADTPAQPSEPTLATPSSEIPTTASASASKETTPASQKSEGKTFVGGETCLGCHDAMAKGWEKNPHHKIGKMANRSLAHACESCHGPGSTHVEAGGGPIGIINPKTAPSHVVNNLCLKCHEKDKLIEARASLHLNEELTCLSCHGIHGNENHKLLKSKKETDLCQTCHAKQTMESKLFSRHPVKDGQMNCTTCHNPHNSKEKMLLNETVNQLCQKCHNNYAGPFVYDHAPVSESCLNCHKAHGSQNRDLLENRVPLLCFRCHGNTQISHEQSIASRQRCIDCHSEIHGSKRDKWFFNNREK